MSAFIDKHFVPLLIAAGILAFVLVCLSVVLFRELTVHYERTRKAMLRFVQFILGIRQAAKGDATADDALAKTVSEPFKAVADPRISKPKIEEEDGG